MSDVEVIDTNKENISEYPAKCFLNPNNIGYKIKLDWIIENLSNGLKIKQLYSKTEKKCIGFIEYVSGENAWRAIDANGYMFIHCIWISPNKYKNKGYGSLLINECVNDAKDNGNYGVAVIVSDGPFMASKDLYLKNDFKSISFVEPSYDLMVKILKKGPLPKFKDWESKLKNYQGLNIVYSNQCPWVARSIEELTDTAKKEGLKLQITELKNANQVQNGSSIYGTFNLIYNGKLLADHYISNRRFQNIIKKNIK